MKNLTNILVKPSDSIKKVMKVIDRGHVKMAVVVDASNKLLGVICDGDIRRAILEGVSITSSVSCVMISNPIHSYKGTKPGKVLRQIKENQITGVPIVDEDMRVVDLALPEVENTIFLSSTTVGKSSIKKVLVIGGGGYIGSVLVRKLLDSGYKVKILDRFLYEIDSLGDIESSHLKIINGDTRHIEILTEAMRDVDAVVHLAELVGDMACQLDSRVTQEINYFATLMIANICKYYQINRFVYISSCSVYGASQGNSRLTEDSPLNPVSLYAKLKIDSEDALLRMADDNFSPTILRLATVYGASYRPRFDLVVNLLTAKALVEKSFSIFGGKQWRPFVHVGDVSKAISAVLEAPMDKVANEVFNVGCDKQNFTLLDIGKLIHQEVPQAEFDVRENIQDERNYNVSFKKIKESLGYNIDINLTDGIREVIDLIQSGKIKDFRNPSYSNGRFLENNNGML